MSTPQNPYGQQPNPYGTPPQQQYPGYAAPPVPPQAGYGGQPHGPSGGWATLSPYPYAPPVRPPKKDHTARNVVIVMASVFGLLGFGFVAADLFRPPGGGSAGGFPAAEYELTAPESLLDGAYELADDQSAHRQRQLESSDPDESNIRDPQATVAQYTSTSEGGVLVLSGMHGRIKDPDTAREEILDGAATAEGATLSVPAKDFTPAGSDVTITCQVVTVTQDGGGTSALPVCAWADGNTNASVAVVTATGAAESPEEIDLSAAARTTAQVREETRKPLT